jgi:eukaryotic-like serine/threonine-protein kinase
VPLSLGTRIGPYEIVSPLGAGGMGEVYRALDTNLNRAAAIKVLPSAFAQDDDRVTRLRREAQVLASLNHPNIAAIYGLETSGQTLALALEFVDGEDLSQRLARGPIPVDEAIAYARQIVDALDAAHEKSIVHRDLKPANVKITREGTVKVLDFGLAKAYCGDSASLASDQSRSPTVAPQVTETGMIVGTAAYMSPEQARGKPVDKRSDVWAFGVVLFEMLTGRPLFRGDTLSDTLAAVLTRDPDWATLPAPTPPGVRRLLSWCVERDPKKRLRDIGDARKELDDVAAATSAVASSRRPALGWLPWTVAAGAVLLAAWGLMVPRAGSASAPEVLHFDIGLPADIEPVLSLSSSGLAIAPDGHSIAMVGSRGGLRKVFVRRFDSAAVAEVAGSRNANAVAFSPDSTSIAFHSGGVIRRVSLTDLQQEEITAGADLFSGLSWSPAGIIFNHNGALWIVRPGGDPPRALTTLDATRNEVLHDHPLVLPGEQLMLFASITTQAGGERIESVPIGGGPRSVIVERATTPVWSSTGHLLFARDGAVLAAPFDPQHPARVAESVTVLAPGVVGTLLSDDLGFRLSSAGTLLYLPSSFDTNRVFSVSRDGAALPLGLPPSHYETPRVSPDGRRVLFNNGGNFVDVLDLARDTVARLTASAVATTFPTWTADGTRVVLKQFNIPVVALADGSGVAKSLAGFALGDLPVAPGPDAGSVLTVRVRDGTAADVFLMSIDGTSQPKPLVATPAYEGGPELSPDGRWLLYQSDASGQHEIYVRPYPSLNRQWQASEGGGIQPRFSRTGREIYYRAGGHLIAVTFDPSGPEPVFGRPTALFADDYDFGRGISVPNYDATPDGRFLMLRHEPGTRTLHAVINWTEELKRLLATSAVAR